MWEGQERSKYGYGDCGVLLSGFFRYKGLPSHMGIMCHYSSTAFRLMDGYRGIEKEKEAVMKQWFVD